MERNELDFGSDETKDYAMMIGLNRRRVMEGARSCFGSGVWLPDKPWIGEDKWKNNK